MFSFSDENIENHDITNEKLNLKSDFSFDEQFEEILHDLMSSINIILLGENIISKKISKETTEVIGKYLKSIRFNSYRIINLANSINSIHPHNVSKTYDKDDFITFNIAEVIENLTISFTPYIEKKNINLKFIKSEEEINICSDIKSIDRIISNLIYNAVKYTNENGNITITLNSFDKKYVEIEVCDDGIGIPKQNIPGIFLRKEKVNKTSEGLGIGLYIAKEKAQMLGGDIKLESTLGKGSKFTVSLPFIESL